MATTPPTYLGQRFAEYGAGWPAADHAAAMACRDLEERLTYALHLYGIAMEAADAVRRGMAETGAVYDLDGARYVEALLTLWVAPAKAALAQVDAMEAKGFHVDRAAEFRAAVLDARVSVSVPVERAAAITERIAREGLTSTTTTEDLRRELRRRVGS